MASAMKKKVNNKITQIVRLKHVMQRWKNLSFLNRSHPSHYSDSESESTLRRTPRGTLAMYVGAERRRFVVPTRFLNLPVFVSLLNDAREEFGYQKKGGLVLVCEVEFFTALLKLLERDEHKFGGFGLDDFLKMASQMAVGGGGDCFSCRDSTNHAACHGLTPLLQKTRV